MYSITSHTIKEEEFSNLALAVAAILSNRTNNSSEIYMQNILPPPGSNIDINCGNIKVKMPS